MTGVPRERGWRIDLIPGRPVRAGGAGCVLPLWVLRDGESFADVDLSLPRDEAGALLAQLSRALCGQVEPPGAPEHGPVSAPCPRGWSVVLVPGVPLLREADGRCRLALRLCRDGVPRADLNLNLSPAEAETLHAQCSRALGCDQPPQAPDARPMRAFP
ncbi:hypothetical protein LHJ74_20405 [Streptomyces sp. N2-109]|uniref:Uncharacterized protein n=1 Tax=Streptomyces gossypii TaxID=2883101 RepID=A0ABT2JWI3_9ACTN|nr:hypothetical protein [Streptomyces gossypii]MCT2592235.1 hypothetical protein [Streptomyces gossypii]